MNKLSNNTGFSLAETLIALGILAVGMVLIAGAFPVAIRLTTISSERTIAAIAAQEAFAKVWLYGSRVIDLGKLQQNQLADFNDSNYFLPGASHLAEYEFTYPSNGFNTSQKQYCWSALCRLTQNPSPDPNVPVQVTVFVCRKAGSALKFPKNGGGTSGWPVPYRINAKHFAVNKLQLNPSQKTYVNDDSIIVDNSASGAGQIYRVIRRLPAPDDDKVQLDSDWPVGDAEAWVVPPPVGGGRNPCIAVYQTEMKF